MSTTTPSSRETRADEGTVAQTAGRNIQGWLLILLVFVAGACSLAVELSASRLLAPYFGTSLFVWSNLIGLILLYLTIGYYHGGRLADRFPRPEVLYALTIIAAFLISVIPFISKPILLWSQSSFATYSVGVFYGSLVSVILLFAVPMILLGCVSPFAIRLRIERLGKSGLSPLPGVFWERSCRCSSSFPQLGLIAPSFPLPWPCCLSRLPAWQARALKSLVRARNA